MDFPLNSIASNKSHKFKHGQTTRKSFLLLKGVVIGSRTQMAELIVFCSHGARPSVVSFLTSSVADKLLTPGVLPQPADTTCPDTEQTCPPPSAQLTLPSQTGRDPKAVNADPV